MPSLAHPTISPYLTGLTCKCPRCGKGPLYNGLLKIAPSCSSCGLDFSFADSGDGPAVFVTTIAGFILAGAALAMEVYYQPPYWVYGLIFLPFSALVCIGLLRPAKALLINLQYFHRAEEGRRVG